MQTAEHRLKVLFGFRYAAVQQTFVVAHSIRPPIRLMLR
jgi:hypothetical protein